MRIAGVVWGGAIDSNIPIDKVTSGYRDSDVFCPSLRMGGSLVLPRGRTATDTMIDSSDAKSPDCELSILCACVQEATELCCKSQGVPWE